MLKIRLMRIGAKKRPFYRVVVVDERAKRNGAYVELVGTYNPLTHPHEIILKQDRIDHWLKMGAVKSDGFLRIIGEAPKRPERKAKKAPREESKDKAESQVADTPESEVEEKTKEVATEEPVIASEQSEAKQSSSEENPTQIAAEPEAPRNDEIEVTEETIEETKEEPKE